MIDYTHPFAAKILEDAFKTLGYSETATRLQSGLKSEAYSIKIFKSLYARPFVADSKTILIGVPLTQEFADIEQVIDIAAGMIELKQIREGYLRPDTEPLKEENIQKQHLKNLDILLHTFPIAEELELEGYKAVEVIRKTGYGKLYKAWLNQAPYQDFINLYWAMF